MVGNPPRVFLATHPLYPYYPHPTYSRYILYFRAHHSMYLKLTLLSKNSNIIKWMTYKDKICLLPTVLKLPFSLKKNPSPKCPATILLTTPYLKSSWLGNNFYEPLKYLLNSYKPPIGGVFTTQAKILDVVFCENNKQLKTANYIRKNFHLRCFPGYWIHLCI